MRGFGRIAPQRRDLPKDQKRPLAGRLHGLLPKLGGGTANFLRADGTWAAPGSGGLGYTLQFLATTSPMNDATTYYFGGQAFTLTELDGAQRVYVPKAGTINPI